jgi:hypothetical protein
VSFENPGDSKRCDWRDQPGKPYTYKGQSFSGLHAYGGECLCQGCLDLAATAELPQGQAVSAREDRYREPGLRRGGQR